MSNVLTVRMQTGNVEMFCFLVCFCGPPGHGSGRATRKEQGGKVEGGKGGRAGEKDVADAGDTVPPLPSGL